VVLGRLMCCSALNDESSARITTVFRHALSWGRGE
jgi:hypothetical protein